jgi:ArsR family transcriptional regulator
MVARGQGKLDLQQMQVAAVKACALLKALGNADRLLLLCQLTQGEYCVSELEAMLGIQQPTLSQQLGVLRDEKLVNTRREGKQIYYSLTSAEAAAVLQVLYQQFCVKPQGGRDGH